jgi:hypothetical protein
MDEEWLLMRYGVLMAVKTSPKTAAAYVSLVKTWHEIYLRRSFGPRDQLVGLTRCLKGLAKMFQFKTGSRAKAPILRKHVLLWFGLCNQKNMDDRMFRAAAATGFQGLLRRSEYTTKKGQCWSHETGLSRADITFLPSVDDPVECQILLAPTKTDQLGENRVPIVLAMDWDAELNACAELRKMILLDPVAPDQQRCTPLFRWRSGAAVTGDQMHKMVQSFMTRIGEPGKAYGAHSLRIGGATALADAGCPDVIIMTMGRWSSSCYKLYCRAAKKSLLSWSKVMGTHSVELASGGRKRSAVPSVRAPHRPRWQGYSVV